MKKKKQKRAINNMLREQEWEEIIKTAMEFSSYKELELLLDKIAEKSIELTQCEGVSIYIKRGEHLDFMLTKNRTLEKKNTHNLMSEQFSIPISNHSIPGYVALVKELLNIENVANLPLNSPYQYNNNLDKTYHYKTISMLTLPMLDNKNILIGILQLINFTNANNKIDIFTEKSIFIAKYLSSIAAIAINNILIHFNIKKSYFEIIEKLAIAAEFRDLETSFHLKRMSAYCEILWKNLGSKDEDEIENVKYATLMHDIGKIGIPDHILQKPGPLTYEERKVMEQHTTIGGKILEGTTSTLLQLSKTVAYTHHEKWDGTGYPNHVKREEIPLIGRIVALADVFDALTSKRVYKPAYSIEKVFAIISEERGKHFDPKLVDIFFTSRKEILDVYHKYKE